MSDSCFLLGMEREGRDGKRGLVRRMSDGLGKQAGKVVVCRFLMQLCGRAAERRVSFGETRNVRVPSGRFVEGDVGSSVGARRVSSTVRDERGSGLS